MEEESELSSSSGSYSSSEEESVGEEEDDDSEEEAAGASRAAGGERTGGRERRKRRRKLVGRRRELRSKYESVKDFNPEARSAQTEEIERIRRLELQRSLQASVPGAVSEGESGIRGLLGSGPVFRNLTEEGEGERERAVEAIVISSDSDDEVRSEGVRVGEVKAEVGEEVEKGGRYDVMGGGDKVVINLGHPPDEEDVVLPLQITRIIKPHQVGGVRFLYDNLIESLTRFHTSTGFGCILAHSMGLGKTLQVISFIDILFRYTPARRVLCVVPVNTLQNWVVEFDKWLPGTEEQQQQRKTAANKSSRNRHKQRSQQNGCPAKSTDLVLPPSINGLPATRDGVSTATTVAGDNIPQSFPGGGFVSNMDPAMLAGLGTHTANPGTANSRSHTGSPSAPDMQYRSFSLFVLSETYRTMESRLKVIKQWREEGGVLLIGYEMYRLLSLSVPSLAGNKMAVKRRKTAKSNSQNSNSVVDLEENEREMEKLMDIQSALCVPGPDLVVCDEGHRIKNDYTNISQALKKISTRRRVVLTGFPLQNNLMEYWCMVDFVRPKYLGTKQEFCDLFERPITNGQCVDSTAMDVRTMRYRSHVLHTLLKGFVLRRGHEILKCSLPMKFEHVLLVRPSPVQAALYDHNMDSLQQGGTSTTAGPLKAFAICTKIWNHPDIYYNESMKPTKSTATSWQDEVGLPKSLLPKGENNTSKVEWPKEALAMLPPYQTGRLDNSPKMVVTMEILDRSVQLGDKLLIFSQSLLALSYIEGLLVRRPIPIPHSAGPAGEVQYSGTTWTKNINFCRLDGSTGSADRDRLITAFNSPANSEMWVFLLSTRAGCLGINLIGANRVIVLDVSWNPCYDAQAVCRVYRYGQTKPCHIYRLVCDGTMEKKIYDRQISKQGMADRVVDELQPERHFTTDEIITLMRPMASLPPPQDLSISSGHFLFDQVLFILCQHFGPLLTKTPFRHESLLLDSAKEKMTEVEKLYAMRGFQQDWNARKRTNLLPTPTVQHTSAPVSPQPHQMGPSSSLATPTQPLLPPSSAGPLVISPYHNTRVGLPSSSSLPHLLPSHPLPSHPLPSHPLPSHSPPSHPLPSHHHPSTSNLQYSQNSTSNLQYSHNSIPNPAPGMGHGNMGISNDIICLDSDSESDVTPPTNVGMAHGVPPVQATLLPGPKVLTVPISNSYTDSAHSLTSHAPSQSGDPTFNATVSQLMAYMRQKTDTIAASQTLSNPLDSLLGAVPQYGGMGTGLQQTGPAPLSSGRGLTDTPSGNPGQYLGQFPFNSGQTCSPMLYNGPLSSTLYTPSNSVVTDTTNTLPQLSPTMTSLLNTTTNNNIAPSPRRESFAPPPNQGSSVPNPANISQTVTMDSRVAHQTNSGPTVARRPNETAASHLGPEITGSSPRPLFSPPKLPLHRELGPVSPQPPTFTSSPQHSTHTGHPGSSPPLPCSPPSALTPSPLSQPPTPPTSIPLLSPVAAHFFHISMSKSPKPTPSPSSHTPTPSPSPSSHPHTLTSQPLSSPPSVSTATSPVVSKTRQSAPLFT